MDILQALMHINELVGDIFSKYPSWSYLILFAVIFAETGLVVTPFLPGDSLIFAAATLATDGNPNIYMLCFVMMTAAILGNMVNYQVGYFLGPKVFHKPNAKILKKEYLDKTQHYFEKHGGSTIILARFIPIVRTFAPLVAGIGRMNYWHFTIYNVVGSVAWVGSFGLLGFWFGKAPFVEEHFTVVVIAVIFISLLPGIYGYLSMKMKSKHSDS
ncbi:MAG: DedA family protein [Hyphomonadaceae bacterium]|nr:DedA family protein [Clostridia bacterium]